MNKGGAMPRHICVIIDAEKAQVILGFFNSFFVFTFFFFLILLFFVIVFIALV